MRERISDLWFTTGYQLEELGDILCLDEITYGIENYWEWIIGTCQGRRIDVTRTHLVHAWETETRLFVLENKTYLSRKLIIHFSTKLLEADISPISIGRWVWLRGNDFRLEEVRKITCPLDVTTDYLYHRRTQAQ